MIKLGTIGTSAICEHFLDGVNLTGKFRLSAVYSRSLETGEAFAKKTWFRQGFHQFGRNGNVGRD